jgi:hypothetical protein
VLDWLSHERVSTVGTVCLLAIRSREIVGIGKFLAAQGPVLKHLEVDLFQDDTIRNAGTPLTLSAKRKT